MIHGSGKVRIQMDIKNMKNDNNFKVMNHRIISIDFLRSFAIFTVVLCHATEKIYTLNVAFLSQISVQSRVFALAAFTVGRLGVPIFIFITGYLLLVRKYDTTGCKLFWQKNWLGLLITTEIWIVLYRLFLAWFCDSGLSIVTFIKNMLFLEHVSPQYMTHMWYMPMIIGLYIFIPFVANAVQSVDTKALAFPMIFAGVVLFAVPVINVLMEIHQLGKISSSIDIGFAGGIYGSMLICGFLVRKDCFKQCKSSILLLLAAAAFLATVGLQLYAYQHMMKYNVWYNNGLLVLCSFALFELGTRIKEYPFKNTIYDLSRCSFGIYLVHNPILLAMHKFIPLQGMLPIQVIVLWFGVFFISWLIVHWISKVPILGRYLFFMK